LLIGAGLTDRTNLSALNFSLATGGVSMKVCIGVLP
jgi:hypothetical protein